MKILVNFCIVKNSVLRTQTVSQCTYTRCMNSNRKRNVCFGFWFLFLKRFRIFMPVPWMKPVFLAFPNFPNSRNKKSVKRNWKVTLPIVKTSQRENLNTPVCKKLEEQCKRSAKVVLTICYDFVHRVKPFDLIKEGRKNGLKMCYRNQFKLIPSP